MNHINDPKMIAFATELDVEPVDLEHFFMELSGNGKNDIDLETFVVGTIKLRGYAKSSDMMESLVLLQRLRLENAALTRFCEHGFQDIQDELLRFEKHLSL